MPINLILVHWSMILDCVIRYGIMMLIRGIKFKELALKLVHTDVISQCTQNMDMQITYVAFNLHGSCYFLYGLNIHLIKMQHFVFHAFSLVSHLGILHNVYSQ
jgi:hypothetical protein